MFGTFFRDQIESRRDPGEQDRPGRAEHTRRTVAVIESLNPAAIVFCTVEAKFEGAPGSRAGGRSSRIDHATSASKPCRYGSVLGRPVETRSTIDDLATGRDGKVVLAKAPTPPTGVPAVRPGVRQPLVRSLRAADRRQPHGGDPGRDWTARRSAGRSSVGCRSRASTGSGREGLFASCSDPPPRGVRACRQARFARSVVHNPAAARLSRSAQSMRARPGTAHGPGKQDGGEQHDARSRRIEAGRPIRQCDRKRSGIPLQGRGIRSPETPVDQRRREPNPPER